MWTNEKTAVATIAAIFGIPAICPRAIPKDSLSRSTVYDYFDLCKTLVRLSRSRLSCRAFKNCEIIVADTIFSEMDVVPSSRPQIRRYVSPGVEPWAFACRPADRPSKASQLRDHLSGVVNTGGLEQWCTLLLQKLSKSRAQCRWTRPIWERPTLRVLLSPID
jgi:hypothetical protein